MDDVLLVYLSMMIVGGLLFLAFWGVVIYLAVRLFHNSNLSTEQKLGITRTFLSGTSGYGGPYEPGPVESRMRNDAAVNGINLDR